ncbi:MAG: ABC transporter permease [Nitrospirae bacterium]|uniref:ABC transporter permease n=1 Tax=Candidatus Magnetobacterium casense TaxID=1455061 RepID=UPI00058ABE20|nr:ABC transporter permease [Candidatus Magnetobacterium casensis]MBF0337870.1 ABC transporter permease [Nitrospirota bacterium]
MHLIGFTRKLYMHRAIIVSMAVQDIQRRYAGTVAGFVWSIINPLVTILVYWFVFSVGLRVQPIGDVPFILFFAAALLPWMTFSETLLINANVIAANSHLIKKMVFPSEILPFVTLLANLITHFVMLAIFMGIMLAYGIPLSFMNLQCLYYMFAMCTFSIGLSWLFAAINVFHKDTSVVLGVIMNIWFWLTPIVYGIDVLPEKFHVILKLNPIFYIAQGYRESFVYGVPLWNHMYQGAYFWAMTLTMLVIGGYVFKKLKPEFAEML